MADRTLGVKLELITAFGSAAQKAVEELGAVRTGLEELGKVNVQFGGLTQLAEQITSLNNRARNAADRLNAMGGAVNEVGTASARSARNIENVGTAAQKVQTQTAQAAQSVLRLTTSLSNLGTIRVDSVGTALQGIAAEAVQAKRATDDLEASLLRLAAAKQQLALGSGMRDSQGFTTNLPYGRAPIIVPIAQAALPGYAPPALPPGSMEWQGYAPRQVALPGMPLILGSGVRDSQGFVTNLPPGRQPIAQPGIVPPQAALGEGVTPMLTGGTDPYYNNRAWWANWRANNPGGGGSGPPINVPPGGFGSGWMPSGGPNWNKWTSMGSDVESLGNNIQGMGWASMINGGMLGAGIIAAGKSAMDIADLLARTSEALKASGVSDANAKKFADATRQISKDTGSDYRETVSAGYNFISALPGDVQRNLNDPKVMDEVIAAYKRVAMMIVAGSASSHHITMEEGSLDANNVIANLGFKTNTPEQIAQAYRDSTNALINLKNRTSTEVDMAAASIKAVGPIAHELGIDPGEIVGLIGMEAEGKVRGQAAGYAIKRILMRQMVPSGKTEKLLQFIDSHGGDLSIFDKNGKMRSLFDVMGDTNKFMDEHHLNQKERGFIMGQLAGLYAVPQEALLLDQMKRHAGDTFTDPKTGKVYHGAAAYGQSLIHGTIKGGKTGDATTDSYTQRTKDNPRIEAAKLSAHLQDAQFQFLKAAEPDIIAFMHALTKLVDVFNALPAPVKRVMVDFAAFTAIASTISGVLMIFGGNSIKLAGGMIKFAGNTGKAIKALRAGEELTGALGVYQKVLGVFGSLASMAWSSLGQGVRLVADGFMFVARSVGMALVAMGPIGWAIMGVIAVSALLYEAWTHDFLGIREHTKAVWDWITSTFQKFPGIVIGLLGPVGLALELIFNKTFREKVVNGISGVISWLQHAGASVGQALGSWADAALKAGAAFIHNLVAGIQSAVHGASGVVKWALQKIRDFFPGSEPKDSSSPLYGMGKSGQAFSDMFIQGILDGMISGDKLKKGAKAHIKKPIIDTIIDLKGESIKEVESMADGIAQAMAKAGGKIKQSWMTLVSGGQADRYYGSASAVHMAESNSKDTTAQQARDYLDNLRRFPQTYDQMMSRLHGLILQSTSAHSIALINSMIGQIEKAHETAIQKLDAYFLKGSKQQGQMGLYQLQSALASVSKEADKFDDTQQKADTELSRQVDRRRNAEIPSLKELEAEQKIVADEQTKLNGLYEDENNKLAQLQSQRSALLARIEALNDADAKQKALKQQLLVQLGQINSAIDTMNDRLEHQGDILIRVDGQLDDYNTKIKDAKKGIIDWQQAVQGAFTTAANTAIQNFADKIDNGVTHLMQEATKRWSSSGSPIMQALSDFVNTFVDTMVKSIIDDVTKNVENQVSNWFSQLANATVGNGGSTTASTQSAGADGSAVFTAADSGAQASGAGPYIAAFLAQQAFGQMMGNAMGGGTHNIWASIGAAVGGFPGAIIGSLFGHGAPNAQNNPDIKATGAWGTDNANLWGAGFNGENAMHANGQSFSMDPNLANQTGGMGLLQYIAQWISQNPTQATSILGSQAVALFSGLNVKTPVTGGSNGTLNLANGQSDYYTNLYSAATSAFNAIQQLGQNALQAAQNADRLAASFTTLLLNGPSGFLIPATVGVGGAGMVSGGSNGGSSISSLPGITQLPSDPNAPSGPQGGGPQQQSITVSILQNASISSDLVSEIEAALPQFASTIAAIVNRANYQSARRFGNYVSAVA